MTLFLAIQSTYDAIELGLFDAQRCIAQETISKFHASAQLIPTLHSMLTSHTYVYTDLAFCAVSQGPGPFTTLRTVIASMNGLAYATNIPLIGVNALEALIQEYNPEQDKNVCALLQAFSGDVYVGLKRAEKKEYISTCMASSLVPAFLEPYGFTQLDVIGNAVPLYQDLLKTITIPSLHIKTDDKALHSSLQGVAQCGLVKWTQKNKESFFLRPLYLKNHIG